jgi:hypothetical protein
MRRCTAQGVPMLVRQRQRRRGLYLVDLRKFAMVFGLLYIADRYPIPFFSIYRHLFTNPLSKIRMNDRRVGCRKQYSLIRFNHLPRL